MQTALEALASNRHYMTTGQLNDILELKKEGLTNYKIGMILGINENSVAYWTKKYGFPTRAETGRPPIMYRVFEKETGEITFTGSLKECANHLGKHYVTLFKQTHYDGFGDKVPYIVERVEDE